MTEGPNTEPRVDDDATEREDAWALGYEAALPWLTCAAPDDSARLAAPSRRVKSGAGPQRPAPRRRPASVAWPGRAGPAGRRARRRTAPTSASLAFRRCGGAVSAAAREVRVAENRRRTRDPPAPPMLPSAAILLAIATLTAIFGIGGLAEGPLGAFQVAAVVGVGAGLGSLLERLAS
ncbi:MAG: hypothetical protein MZW92_26465 [Comamonadaceae bacterium]|nr:hypothetical protein [Comamonadaceae bacterium]